MNHYGIKLQHKFIIFTSMKIFLLIFNLYLLVLPCLSCADADDCVNEDKTSIGIHTNGDNPTKENHEDNCTPFCHCACCTTSIVFQLNNIERNSKVYYTTVKFSTIDINFISNDINAIWQPPKFAA